MWRPGSKPLRHPGEATGEVTFPGRNKDTEVGVC
jgi:hypothetical protein